MQDIQTLYKKIHTHVASSEIKTLIKEFKGLKEDKLKKIISSSGLLDEMSRKIQNSKNSKCTNSIKIQTGYGFPENTILKLHVLLWGQRVCCIGKGNSSYREFNIEITAANDLKESLLHAVVIKEDDEELEILGVGEIDLKEKLSTLKIRDLHDDQITVGVLDLDLSNFNHFLDSEKEIFKIQKRKKVKEEQYKAFVNYAKKWWNQFLQIRSSHEQRLVKIFVNSERGKTVVSSFIYPIKETPNHAARFTGLIPFEESKECALLSDVWQDLHTFLSLGKGSGIDHAILLCNLFLGFSLDAFVSLGLDSKSFSKAWVTVLNNDKPEFWDPLSGTIISSESLSSLGCIFNNCKFYANISPLEFPNNFILSQSCNWKELSLPTTLNPGQVVSILRHPLSLLENTAKVESDIRNDLIKFIKAYRSNVSLDTVISEELSWIQSQTLWHQEFSKLFKEYKNLEQFNQMGIKSLLKPQEIYRGFPLSVNFVNSYRIFSLITASKTGRKILLSSSDNTRLGVSVRVYFYGESSLSVWLLFSAIFK